MKKLLILLIFIISCINSPLPEETSTISYEEVSFMPATTIQSEYDKLKEGDKKSYKIRKYWIQNILKDIPELTDKEKEISYNEANDPTNYVTLEDGTGCALDVGGTIHGTLIDENFQLDFNKINNYNYNSSSTLEKIDDSLFNDGYQITLIVSYNCGKDGIFSWLYGPLFFQDGQWWSFTDTDTVDFPLGEGNYWRQSSRVRVYLNEK